MEEEKQEQEFTPPPTGEEVAPESKELRSPHKTNYVLWLSIALVLIIIGGLFYWFTR